MTTCTASIRPAKSRTDARCRILAVALALWSAPMHAQNTTKPWVGVAPIVLAEPLVETAIPIDVGPADGVPRNAFLRVRGLPPQATFSDGHAVSSGTWALPIIGLANLKVTLPLAAPGRSELLITLLSTDGTVLVETKTVLAVTASALGQGSPTDIPTPPVARLPGTASLGAQTLPVEIPRVPLQRLEPTPTAPGMKPEERERALKLLGRGDAEFASGDVAAARLLYQRAADAGLGEAALALGSTFDPAELAARGVKGLQADPPTARKWYERARSLGIAAAEVRLRRIGQQ
jgi:hypothetical protein